MDGAKNIFPPVQRPATPLSMSLEPRATGLFFSLVLVLGATFLVSGCSRYAYTGCTYSELEPSPPLEERVSRFLGDENVFLIDGEIEHAAGFDHRRRYYDYVIVRIAVVLRGEVEQIHPSYRERFPLVGSIDGESRFGGRHHGHGMPTMFHGLCHGTGQRQLFIVALPRPDSTVDNLPGELRDSFRAPRPRLIAYGDVSEADRIVALIDEAQAR